MWISPLCSLSTTLELAALLLGWFTGPLTLDCQPRNTYPAGSMPQA